MRLESVAFSGSFGERRYTLDELRLHSRHGYFTAANSVLIGSWRGDVVSVMPRRETFPAGDRVELRLTFSRPALVNHEACR